MKTETYRIEKQTVFGDYEEQGCHQTFESAQKALPYHRKDTGRPLRIVRVIREVMTTNFAAGGKKSS